MLSFCVDQQNGIPAAEGFPKSRAAWGGEIPAWGSHKETAAGNPGHEEHLREIHSEYPGENPWAPSPTLACLVARSLQGQDSSPALCSLQGFSEQEISLKNQIKELEADVVAATPDKAKQKELEKALEGYKKGTFCREGIRDKSCSNLLVKEEGMGLGLCFSSLSWFGASFFWGVSRGQRVKPLFFVIAQVHVSVKPK